MSAVETTILPPSYSDLPNDEADAFSFSPTFELPAYSPNRLSAPRRSVAAIQTEYKDFNYEVQTRGKTYAVLTITAEKLYSKHLPTYLEGMPVKGKVTLSLDKPDTIQSVVISITGQLITGSNPGEQITFLQITQTLWSQTEGQPRNASRGSGETSTVDPSSIFNGKLLGNFTWNFSVDLPKEVTISVGTGNKAEKMTFSLPQTFNERFTRGSIAYEVAVRFTRGKLRTDHKIPAQFGYVPIIRPPPLPLLRQLAYMEGTQLVGPSIDLDGWHAAETIRLKGELFKKFHFDIGCTLFLSKPLAYTRSSVIPLCLRLEGEDQQALDVLSSTKSIRLRLRRCIKYHWDAEKVMENFGWRDAIDHSQLATWWPSSEGSEECNNRFRFVNGELHLRTDLKPTSAIGHFRIDYSVILLPFDAPGVELEETRLLLQQKVDILTAFTTGPRPRMMAPPGYESEVPTMTSLNTAGLLQY